MRKVTVRLRDVGLIANFVFDGMDIEIGDYIIVEADRGMDYGQVIAAPEKLFSEPKKSVKKVLRIMSVDDFRVIKENRIQAKESLKTCSEKVKDHRIKMKLLDAEYSFDKSKIIFYFTSENRVDFRELVKDLAKIFKTRIEMRQVGVRDETRLFGGIGPCGRRLCCRRFLKNFEPVTIKMAKEQKLPLNPTKISGICGRLMCCLNYEYRTYVELGKKLPREGKIINTPKGKAKVLDVNPLKREVFLEYETEERERVIYGPQ